MKYIIREGTVRGQGSYLAWDSECAPRIGSAWSDGMIKAVYEDRNKAEEAAKRHGGRVVRLTTKAETVRKERAAVVRRIRWVAVIISGHYPEGASALLGVATAIERGDHRKEE